MDVMQGLGVSISEAPPGGGQVLRGCLDRGWVCLTPQWGPTDWGAEPVLVRHLADRLERPLRWLRLEGVGPLDASHRQFQARLRAEELRSALDVRPLRLVESAVEHKDPDCEGHDDPHVLAPALWRFLDDLAWRVLPRLGRTPDPARHFYARIPEGWRAPPPPQPQDVPVVVEVSEKRLPPESLPWLRHRLASAGALAEEPAPDLKRWERRLLRRMGLSSPPEADTPERAAWEEALDRLTRGDRGREVPGKFASWKLEPGHWTLSEAEAARARRALGHPSDPEQARWAEAWLEALRPGAELSIRDPET